MRRRRVAAWPVDAAQEVCVDRFQICRIVDANLNRAGEALREIEDAARFGLNAASLARRAKELRHRLDSTPAMLGLTLEVLAASRDAQGDVGRPEANSVVTPRHGVRDVVAAAFKRLQQALRCLEEYSKVLRPGTDPGFEAMRYASYSLEKDLLRRLMPRPAIESARLYLLLIPGVLSGSDADTALRLALEGGVDLVQIRDKGRSDQELLRLAGGWRARCADAGIPCLINDRVDVACALGADGVHLGAEDLPLEQARAIVGSEKILGSTAHSLEEALAGQHGGADYLGFGTMFPTGTKPGLEVRGLEEIEKLSGRVNLPVFAIGGITLENLPQLLERGVRRVAVSAGILRAEDIRRAAEDFKKKLLGYPL
ncbi:MAG: thiamine phosphate synthase [Planctomycetes bacterium]|nr:thiamine phosphate synthase [Planctomycetota bacterium]